MLICAICKKPYEDGDSTTNLSATLFHHGHCGRKYALICYNCMVGEAMPLLEKKFKFKVREIK